MQEIVPKTYVCNNVMTVCVCSPIYTTSTLLHHEQLTLCRNKSPCFNCAAHLNQHAASCLPLCAILPIEHDLRQNDRYTTSSFLEGLHIVNRKKKFPCVES